MKSIKCLGLGLIGALLLSSQVYAKDQNRGLSRIKNIQDIRENVLKCSYRLLDSVKESDEIRKNEVYSEINSFFQTMNQNRLQEGPLKKLLNTCEDSLAYGTLSIDQSKVVSLKSLEFGNLISRLIHSENAVCTTYGMQLSAGVLLAGTAGLQAGVCENSRGERKAVIAPEAAFGIGMGGFIILKKSSYKSDNFYDLFVVDEDFETRRHGSRYIAVIGAGVLEGPEYDRDGLARMVSEYKIQKGLAVGLGDIEDFNIGQATIKIFKMSSNYKNVLKEILK